VTSKPPVVLVHGLTASTDWWRPTIAALEHAHDLRIVRLPGMRLRDASRWLAEWLAKEGLRGADLVGHSMGGTIALLTAAEAPDSVGRLALIAPAGIFASRTRRSFVLPLARSTLVRVPKRLPWMVRDVMHIGPRRLWRVASDLLQADVTPSLHAVRAPTLVVWGADDRLLPPTLGQLFSDQIPDSRLVVLPRCGHIPMVEAPDELHDHLLRFLS
jgi:pimeloyl-ACP methyl ester carboxylesterase